MKVNQTRLAPLSRSMSRNIRAKKQAIRKEFGRASEKEQELLAQIEQKRAQKEAHRQEK